MKERQFLEYAGIPVIYRFWNPQDEQIINLSLIFEFDEEITEIIGNEKDETKLIFEKYQLSLTTYISTKT